MCKWYRISRDREANHARITLKTNVDGVVDFSKFNLDDIALLPLRYRSLNRVHKCWFGSEYVKCYCSCLFEGMRGKKLAVFINGGDWSIAIKILVQNISYNAYWNAVGRRENCEMF